MSTGPKQLHQALRNLSLIGKPLVVHSSLKSFGYFDGGAEALVQQLCRDVSTVLMPGFSRGSVVAPPKDDYPLNNGCDYHDASFWTLNSNKPFDILTEEVDPRMGAISRCLSRSSGVRRSPHPWHSWSVLGDNAEYFAEPHHWDVPNLPLKKAIASGAQLLLLGVGIQYCTALHLAEEHVGRRPFIRWALDRDRKIKRMRVNGCANGFAAFWPGCSDLFKQEVVGSCRLLSADLAELVSRASQLLLEQPKLVVCSENCLRCRDAVLGGPLDISDCIHDNCLGIR